MYKQDRKQISKDKLKEFQYNVLSTHRMIEFMAQTDGNYE